MYSNSCWSWASQSWSASEKWQQSSQAEKSEESLVLSYISCLTNTDIKLWTSVLLAQKYARHILMYSIYFSWKYDHYCTLWQIETGVGFIWFCQVILCPCVLLHLTKEIKEASCEINKWNVNSYVEDPMLWSSCLLDDWKLCWNMNMSCIVILQYESIKPYNCGVLKVLLGMLFLFLLWLYFPGVDSLLNIRPDNMPDQKTDWFCLESKVPELAMNVLQKAGDSICSYD